MLKTSQETAVKQDALDIGILSPADFKSSMSTPEMHRLLRDKVSHASKIAGVNIYDADGVLINSSEVANVPDVRVDDRAYFKALKFTPNVAEPQMEMVLSR